MPRAVRLRRNRLRAPIGTSRLELHTPRNIAAMHARRSRRRDTQVTAIRRPRRLPRARSSPRTTAVRITGDQPYEAQPLAGGTDHYEAEQGSHRFPLGQSEHQQDFYDEAPVEDEYYEDAQPSRRRIVVMAIAGVAALAVIGTAGAFGYRALVGSPGSTKPPPVIKADTAPSKIVPATIGKDAQSNKLITDRVNERGQSEKLVSREEQPLDRPTAVDAVAVRAADGPR